MFVPGSGSAVGDAAAEAAASEDIAAALPLLAATIGVGTLPKLAVTGETTAWGGFKA